MVASFDDDGFLILERLLSEPEIQSISEAVDKYVQGNLEDIPEADIIYEQEGSTRCVRNVFRLTDHNKLFFDLACHPKIISVVAEILDPPVRLYSSQLFAKPPRIGSSVPLHQDLAYWPFTPAELLSTWIALDESNIDNGCVRFFCGSHKLGLLPHAPSGVIGNSLYLERQQLGDLEERPIEVPRGSVVLHHCLTVHRSEPNRSTAPRRGLVMIYMSGNVRVTDPQKLKGSSVFPVVSF